jgi:alpha-tubulin suppressor-like RCC1 family protein
LTVTDRIYCWGWNLGGEVGDGTTTTRLKPVPILSERSFRQVSVGGLHSCAVTRAYKALCWGFNEKGQLGNGSTAELRLKPVPVAGELLFIQISAGHSSTCAVTSDHRAYCWGSGRNGEIGDGKLLNRWTPRAVSGGLSFDRVSSIYHSCGETTDNLAYCWGPNFVGQLGDGTGTTRLTPTAVAGGLRFKQVSAGGQHTCGVSSGSVAYCWGDNPGGELGDGTTETRRTPVAVAGPM